MSADQTVNSDTIEQTKQQIRGLVGEIARLSKSELEAEEYYPAFLERIVAALAAVGGAVWVMREGRRLDMAYQIKMSDTLLNSESDEAARHFALLNQVAATAEPKLVPPLSGPSDQQSAGNPTRYLLVLAPLTGDNQVEAVIEIFQRPDAQPVTQRGYLKFLVQMCELASEWVKTRKLRQISDRHSLWAEADQFSRMVHENLDLMETAFTVVNEGRRIVGCDRVSVGILRRGKCTIAAVSGQDTIENRSNIAKFLGHLATRVVATGESLWYEGSTDNLPPQIEEALHDYIDESHTKMLAVLPLRRPKRTDDVRQTVTGEADDESNQANEIVGALIVEQMESDLPREVLRSRTDLVYEHSARALTNALDYNNIFLLPLWRTIGKTRMLVRARTLPKTVLAAAALVLLLLVLFVVHKDFSLQAEGSLQPKKKYDIFVPVDGEVMDCPVMDQEQVKKGQLLIRLRNTDLDFQYQEALGQLASKREQLSSIEYALLNSRKNLSEAERVKLSGDKAELGQEVRALVEQRKLLEQKRKKLEILSPINGEVMMSWDVRKTIKGRPVTTGQVLMNVVDPAGDWELELHMRESRSGHVRQARQRAQEDTRWAQRYPGAGSDVSFVLQTDPSTTYKGTIREIKGGTDVREEKHVVDVKVDIEPAEREKIGNPRPGTTLTGQVFCGRRSCGYVWFHEAWEWIQLHVFFKWFS
jgi:multidrug efflux pump subunit AcrA (membrane-fusion protein)